MSGLLIKNKDLPVPKLKLNFSGHETFTFRYTWLKKVVDAISQDSLLFDRETALSELGVGKNMVYSMKHWGVLTEVIQKAEEKTSGYNVTEFGKNLFSDNGWDPYLEDIATLWLLHWKISNNINIATTWYFVFNRLTQIEFTKEQLINELVLFAEVNGIKCSPAIIERDVQCFIRTYVSSKDIKPAIREDGLDCPLTELSLIQELGQRGLYVFMRGQQRELSNEIFTYSLIDYWNKLHCDKDILSFDALAYGHGSPGLVFKIDEDSLTYRLEGLEKLTKGALRYDETSRIRQIYRIKNTNPNDYLKKYYQQFL